MRSLTRLAGAALIAVTVAALASPAGAAVAAQRGPRFHRSGGARDAVFVQTDNTAGNQVLAYHRAADGRLSPAGAYRTGGLGGQLAGSVVDHLASQGSLSYDPEHALLYAVNAGSNTISVFAVAGDRLSLRQVIGSGGEFPVSVAVHGDLVYALNAENGGSVQGYRVLGDHLAPIPGSSRALGLNPAATPQYTNTPGQVTFSPDGRQLIVTTKANGNDIDVFGLTAHGDPAGSPTVNSEPGAVPFAVTFDSAGHLVVSEAGPSMLATFTLHGNGAVTPISAVPDGQSAQCWVTRDRDVLFASNAGSASVSTYSDASGGHLALLGATSTDPGTVDSAASPGGRYLYVQTGGNGVVDEFAVTGSGTLAEIGSVTVPGAVGGEGIVAP
jgi:6-phosphogluconolactonase (cycloisomerase 2 family)